MHTLYKYNEDSSSDEERAESRVFFQRRPPESWHDETEAPSVPRSCNISLGSYSYIQKYPGGIVAPKEVIAQKNGILPHDWYINFWRSDKQKQESRKHTALIIFVTVLTFLLGVVVGHFIWVSPTNDHQTTTGVASGNESSAGGIGSHPTTQPPTPADNLPVHDNPSFPASPSPIPFPTAPPMYHNATEPPDSSLSSGALTVGAYYYPWYKDDFHRGDGYVRKQLSPPQKPWLGEYDDSDPATISKHLQWSRQANIGLWVSSWWGEGSREDHTLKTTILAHPELNSHQFAIFYETTGRIRQSEGFTPQRVQPDIEYLCRQYFNHPNYFRLDEKPVLFVYLTRKLEATGTLTNVVELMRLAAKNAGCGEVFMVGDHIFQGPPETEDVYPPFTLLDAVTNYDVYGSMGGKGGYMGQDGVVNYYKQQSRWKEIANVHNCKFIPAASPGYNDLGVRPKKPHPPLSRKLSVSDQQGSLFEAALRQARTLVDGKAKNLLMINSFNEFHEGKREAVVWA